MNKIKNIFDWLEQISYKKEGWGLFSEEDKGKYNNYLINRFISMNPNFLEVVNLAQQYISPQDSEKSYLFYKSVLGKKKRYFKYIKSKSKVYHEDVFKYLGKYFGCSLETAKDYTKLLKKKDIENILKVMNVKI